MFDRIPTTQLAFFALLVPACAGGDDEGSTLSEEGVASVGVSDTDADTSTDTSSNSDGQTGPTDGDPCSSGPVEVDFSYIWIANSPMGYNLQRPIAWAPAEAMIDDAGDCQYINEKVWTTGAYEDSWGSVVALRLDGQSGGIDDQVAVPELGMSGKGPYGGAVDPDGNFWFITRWGPGPYPLVRVDGETLTYNTYQVTGVNPYGISIDSAGRVWLAGDELGSSRFDPATETFTKLPGITGHRPRHQSIRGLQWLDLPLHLLGHDGVGSAKPGLPARGMSF